MGRNLVVRWCAVELWVKMGMSRTQELAKEGFMWWWRWGTSAKATGHAVSNSLEPTVW